MCGCLFYGRSYFLTCADLRVSVSKDRHSKARVSVSALSARAHSRSLRTSGAPSFSFMSETFSLMNSRSSAPCSARDGRCGRSLRGVERGSPRRLLGSPATLESKSLARICMTLILVGRYEQR